MIVATVTTCPQRWREYRSFRESYEKLRLPCSLRTFQTTEGLGTPRVNANLNARAALKFCAAHLPGGSGNWMLYLEDDVHLSAVLPELLDDLLNFGETEGVDCWYLCNRRNPQRRQFTLRAFTLCELGYPIYGAHALLLPARHLEKFLAANWREYVDQAIFETLAEMSGRVWQVVNPVLAEHLGEYSTFEPLKRKNLEINYASTSDSYPPP